MTIANEPPVELLEAQRLIRAKQVKVVPDIGKPPETVEEASKRLLETIRKLPRNDAQREAGREQIATMQKLRHDWNAPARHVARTLLEPVREWHDCLDALRAKVGTGFTVALVGKRGPGKTQIAVELMRGATVLGLSAYYCTAMDYLMRIKDAFHADRQERQSDAQKFFARFKLLVIDEMNVRSDTPWEDNMLADLIGKRYNGMLDTVLVSNETAAEFEHSVGPSIIDRLNETGGIVECNWRSFRE